MSIFFYFSTTKKMRYTNRVANFSKRILHHKEAILSAILMLIATFTFNEWICFIGLVPLLWAAKNDTQKLLQWSSSFGITYYVGLYYWIPSDFALFTRLSPIWGILPLLFGVVIMSLTIVAVFWLYHKISFSNEQKWAKFFNPLVLAIIWTLMEALRLNLFDSFPLLAHHIGFPLTANLFFIQPVEVFGYSILSFIVVYINASLAQAILVASYRFAMPPVFALVVYTSFGWGLYQNYETDAPAKAIHKVALICPNTAAEFKWEKENANLLVGQMLDLYSQAVKNKPEIVLWPETALPWRFSDDDDFLKELVKINDGRAITNVIGMNTAVSEQQVYNSAYAMATNGQIIGRYDKHVPLAFLETPVANYQIMFGAVNGISVKAGTNPSILNLPLGKAGMMICNESVIPNNTAMDADFLLNLSNDSWFLQAQIVCMQHFYNARLRAVETRRDIITNSNQGYCGHIAASGKILSQSQSEKGQLLYANIALQKVQTMAQKAPHWFHLILLVSLIITIFHNTFLNF
jgi:apolipoprotein N-acyltransferase